MENEYDPIKEKCIQFGIELVTGQKPDNPQLDDDLARMKILFIEQCASDPLMQQIDKRFRFRDLRRKILSGLVPLVGTAGCTMPTSYPRAYDHRDSIDDGNSLDLRNYARDSLVDSKNLPIDNLPPYEIPNPKLKGGNEI